MKADNKVRWHGRRAFLAGAAGTVVALPALHSLLPRSLWAQDAPVHPQRFLAWMFPCGIPNIDRWKPEGTGTDWQVTELLEALAPVKQHVSVLSDLRNEGRGPDHTYGVGAFLTGRLINTGNNTMGGPSIDQVIADGLQENGTGAAVHSVQLGIQENVCEPNIVCFPNNNISYNNGGNPITKRGSAADAFDALFEGFTAPEPGSENAAAERRARRLSVLDGVIADTGRLGPALSYTDRLKLENYLESIRTVEREVENTTVGGSVSCELPDGVNDGNGIDQRIEAFSDVMALAFECDLTRVITFMAASGATGTSKDYPNYHLGITHEQAQGWQAAFIATVKWEVEKFANLVARLATKTEIDGVTPILDNSALFMSSEISHGNNHNHDEMPVLLAGGLGGAFPQGSHIQFNNEYFADLFMYIAQNMGVPLNSFGANGQGRITNL